MTKTIKIKDEEYELEDPDAALIEAIKELTKAIEWLAKK